MVQKVENLPAMQETQVRFLEWEDALEKGKATHSSILAWRIPQNVEKIRLHAPNVGGQHLIPRLGRSPREENGNTLQYSCLENSMDRGAWWATVHGVAKNQTLLK